MEELLKPNENQVIVARAWERGAYDKDYPTIVEVKLADRWVVRESDNMIVTNPELEEYTALPFVKKIAPSWEQEIMISSDIIRDGMGGQELNQVTIVPGNTGIYCKDAFTAYTLCRASWLGEE